MYVTATAARWWAPLLSGLKGVSWTSFALIAAINTGFAVILSIEDTRPFWHPFVTAQCFGLSIAYAVNAASPWEKPHPVWRLTGVVAIGTSVGFLLLLLVKGYTLDDMHMHRNQFVWTAVSGFSNGLFVSLFFMLKFREARAQTQILKAQADRNLLAKQAVEAELKLMQAQVEPHFLFNTLASVQYLSETDPPRASEMLGHLLSYLRAALPQLRSDSATLGQELELAQAYLSIMRMRMGPRLTIAIDVQPALRAHRFAPMLLMSLVENAIKHGLEPQAEGGSVTIFAHRRGDTLVVGVGDDGQGLSETLQPGIGLSNLRERLHALYGGRARFTIRAQEPKGVYAEIAIPYDAHADAVEQR